MSDTSRRERSAPLRNPDASRPFVQRKAYRACVACVNSKIRCEGVVYPEGCLRCRTKKRECSLATPVSTDDAEGSGSGGIMLCRMRALEDELADMKAVLQQVQADRMDRFPRGIDSHRSESSLVATPARPSPARTISTSQLTSALNWRRVQVSEGLFSMSSATFFPDPVGERLLTMDELERAFDVLKVRISSRYPTTPFLLSSTPLPKHPFVRLAIAAHTSPSAALYHYIDSSLLIVATGSVTVDVLLALFIMSLAPFPADYTKAPITSLRYIALAYNLGQTMGLDNVSKTTIESYWLKNEQWSGLLEDILLWEAIRNRYTLIACMQSRLSTTITTGAIHLPRDLSRVHDMVIRNLVAERQLFAIVAPLLSLIGEAEVEPIGLSPDTTSMLSTWASIDGALEDWRLQVRLDVPGGLLLLDSHALSFSLAFRMSCIVQRIPTPVIPEARWGSHTLAAVAMLRQAHGFCVCINRLPEIDLPTLPSYLLSQYTVAVAVQQRSLEYFRSNAAVSEDLSRPVVEASSNKIENVIRGLPALLLQDIQSHLIPIPDAPASGVGSGTTEFVDLFEGLPADFWQFLQPNQATHTVDNTWDLPGSASLMH